LPRLTAEVREQRGLTYGVYSYFSPGLHAGAFTVGLQTGPIRRLRRCNWRAMWWRALLPRARPRPNCAPPRTIWVGGFALRIDTNRKLLDNVANIAAHRLPLDYLDTWTRQVEQVTVAQVRAAFARKLQPDRMATVVLGATGPAGRGLSLSRPSSHAVTPWPPTSCSSWPTRWPHPCCRCMTQARRS